MYISIGAINVQLNGLLATTCIYRVIPMQDIHATLMCSPSMLSVEIMLCSTLVALSEHAAIASNSSELTTNVQV